MKQKTSYYNNVKTILHCHTCDNLKSHSLYRRNAVLKKQFLSITNLAHLYFFALLQNPKKLNFFPQQYGVLSAQYCASRSAQSKAPCLRQQGILFFHFLKISYISNILRQLKSICFSCNLNNWLQNNLYTFTR